MTLTAKERAQLEKLLAKTKSTSKKGATKKAASKKTPTGESIEKKQKHFASFSMKGAGSDQLIVVHDGERGHYFLLVPVNKKQGELFELVPHEDGVFDRFFNLADTSAMEFAEAFANDEDDDDEDDDDEVFELEIEDDE